MAIAIFSRSTKDFPVDIATIIGLLGGFGMLFGAVLLEGSNPMSFMNLLATCVVFGGATMAVMGRYTLGGFVHGVANGFKGVLFHKHRSRPSS